MSTTVLPKSQAGAANAADAVGDRLRRECDGEVYLDAASRGRYATDASIYQIMPLAVVVPKTAESARIAVQIAAEHNMPILPRGGGTSQCGQTVGAALVIDNSKYLNQALGIDADARTATVEPGIVLDHLNAKLKPHGLWYPVDVSTAAQATIGGMAGNNSCGSRSIHYGNMVHNVAAIEALLADGTIGWLDERVSYAGRLADIAHGVRALCEREADEIAARFPPLLRRVAGYNLDIFAPKDPLGYNTTAPNLAHLLVGSEGTLAYFRKLKLKLSALPTHKVLGVVNFPSFHQAMDLTQHIVTLSPTAVELVDRTMIDLARGNPAFRPVIEEALIGEPDAILLVEFAGDDLAAITRKLDDLAALMGDLGVPSSVVKMTHGAQQKRLWDVRKAGLNIMMSMRGDGKPVSFIEDCAVPLEHLADYTRRLTDVFTKHGTRGTWYAHASVGTLHVRPILNMKADGAHKMRAIAEEAAQLVREYKGVYSGEHGDGLVRSEWIQPFFGPRLTAALAEVKALFDPKGLMNPGKIVAPPRQDDRRLFRYQPEYRVISLNTKLDWREHGANGLAGAVEMCNNNGHCRKFDEGTMCPSYRVTRNEAHLTRGRANTLRLALSNQLPGGLASEDVKAAMDLCVSCKGCKRDCPTGVDMAKMKIEFQAAYKAQHGWMLRDKLIAHLPRYAPWISRLKLASVVNAMEQVDILREMRAVLTRFAASRTLPTWASQTFLASTKPSQGGQKEVVLWADTFNNYFEPNVLHAAERVLSHAGYTVHRLAATQAGSRPLCCGRTYFATGMLDAARAEITRSVSALMPYVSRGVAVVGLEPSCLLTLRDEWVSLIPTDETRTIAANAFLLEAFLVREQRAGRLSLSFAAAANRRALLHGHCHQKAFGEMSDVEAVLSWIPGLTVEAINSSCCGMAGSFGYEDEHVATSQAMAEWSLLPAVRAASDAVVIADGTSCRHQISLGADRAAKHAVEVLASALAVE
jgi:FAD/FMN-containing dehydrogenase/Fe-S oxidoreductase